jgi:hypothetical protein
MKHEDPRPRAGSTPPLIGWLIRDDRWATAIMLIGFAVLILLGITTSSIGIGHLAQDPDNPLARGFGAPQNIRSDEYNIWSPVWMSIMNTGTVPTLSPLGVSGSLAHRYPSGGFFETIVFFPALLLRAGTFLPQEMVFAAMWWLPSILVFLALPGWMARVAGNRRLGWLAALLIVLSPATAWWSFGPVTAISYPIAGCTLLLIAFEAFRDGRRVRFIASALGSGVLLASIPTLYAPWALVLAVPLVFATVAWIACQKTAWTQRIWPVAIAGVSALVLAAGTIFENREVIATLAGTVYPGQRRSGSVAQSFAMLFGAPGFAAFGSQDPIISNASELSTAFTICVLWAAVLVVGARFEGPWKKHLPLIIVGGSTLAWLGWSTLNSGGAGQLIPVMNLVPPYRSAQVVGVLATITACMLVGLPLTLGRRKIAIIAGVLCAAVTGYAVSLLQSEAAPFMPTWLVYASALCVGTVVFAVTIAPTSIWPVALAGVVALAGIATAQPILVGLGDLHDSETAKIMRERGIQARADGTLWVSDRSSFDSLMLANAVPSISGFQRSGPDVAEWERLDPDHEFIDSWNRGGGYLPFRFTPGEPLSVADNGFDLTLVSIDPCELAERFPEVEHVASSFPLDAATCVSPDGEVEWNGAPTYLYKIVR